MRRTVAVVAIVFVVAGCGRSVRLSADEYRARANAACAELERKSSRLFNPESRRSAEKLVGRQLRYFRRLSAQLRALRSPRALETDAAELVTSIERVERVLRAHRDLAVKALMERTADTPATARLEALFRPLAARLHRVSRRLALSRCFTEA